MEKQAVHNILVFNVNWVGDVIFSTPIFKALKRRYPGAAVSCLAVPRVKEILECSPGVDEVILFDEKGRHRCPWGKLGLVRELRRRRFDMVFLLHRSWTRALLVFLAGIPQRIGYDTKNRGGMLTHKVASLPEQPHRSDYYLHVIESFGIVVEDRTCELTVDPDARMAVERILTREGLASTDTLVVVNPGGNWDLKRWPKEDYAVLVQRLRQELGVKVVLTGAAKDTELVREIKALSQADVVIMAGRTSLKELVALMARADLVVSADSGPLHIANSVGTPAVALFGPTRPQYTGPRGAGPAVVIEKEVGCNHQPCYVLDCPENVCMKAITVEDVMAAVRQQINMKP